jgi:hypothetical protein
MQETRRYDLQELETDYREMTARNDLSAKARVKSIIATIRYDLRMGIQVIMEYRDGFDEPMIMRQLEQERDLDRWISQRFIRLEEFESF